jgi:hypothetical protein
MVRRLVITGLLVFSAYGAWSQGCSVCTKTAAGLDDKKAKGLNGGIIYLAAVPLSILGTLGFVWWKHNKAE